MKPPEDQIRQALLHPDRIVRDVALRYFGLAFSRDRGVMTIVAQAIEKYGADDAFDAVWLIPNLPLPDEALLWLAGRLNTPAGPAKPVASWMSSVISHGDAGLLARHESRLESCRWLTGKARKTIRDKVRLLSVSTESCWRELQSLCDRHKDDGDASRFEFDRATQLVEAISRDGDRSADLVLAVLSSKIETPSRSALAWLEIAAAMLAGRIRLDPAAPLLVAKLKDDDGDLMNEECTYGLTRIGSDAAIEAIAREFHSASSHYRLYASSALRDMRGEKVVATALELLKGPEDGDTRAKFVGAALANFDTEGLRAASEFGVDDLPELRRPLIATAVLTGASFPDLDRLREEELGHQAEVRQRQEWLAGLGRTMQRSGATEPPAVPAPPPVKSGRKIGRNEPCPCGSGRKYKKCCMGTAGGTAPEK